jgi:hypothetical protein
VYVPSLRRLSSYVVTTWRTNSFEICKQITVDTPVEYHQMDDLSYGPATAALLPKIMRAARKPAVVAMTAEKERAQDGPTGDAVSAAGDVLRAALARRLAANAQHVADGVKALEKEGVASFSAEVLAEVRADEDRALATAAALAAASADDVTLEIRIHGNTIAFWQIEIITDVGISVNTVTDSVKLLRVVNADFPVARRFNDDQLCEKLLSMIEHGSKMFALEAKKELDSIEGVPGTPGVRQFQLAAPLAGGPRPRDLNGIIMFWQGQWESAVKSNALPPAAATGQAGVSPFSSLRLAALVCRAIKNCDVLSFLGDGHRRAGCPAPPQLWHSSSIDIWSSYLVGNRHILQVARRGRLDDLLHDPVVRIRAVLEE